MLDLIALKTEIITDPTSLGYTGKTSRQQAEIMNSESGGREVDSGLVLIRDIVGATDHVEFESLAVKNKEKYNLLMGNLDASVDMKSPNIRRMLGSIFPAGSKTRASLVKLQKRSTTRAAELFGEEVKYWDIEKARAL